MCVVFLGKRMCFFNCLSFVRLWFQIEAAMPKWTQPHCSLIGNIIRFYKPEVVKICTVSAMSFSISGRILSLYSDKSALFKHDSILGIYCGFAKPTCARAFTHCLAVIGFSSVIYVRKLAIMASKRFSSPHWALAARMYGARFLTNDFGWSSNEAKSSKYAYHSSVSRLSEMILSARAHAYLSYRLLMSVLQ